MNQELKFVINVDGEYWAFTHKPKLSFAGGKIQFKRKRGYEVKITELWNFFYQSSDLYEGYIYKAANIAKTHLAFNAILELAQTAFMGGVNVQR